MEAPFACIDVIGKIVVSLVRSRLEAIERRRTTPKSASSILLYKASNETQRPSSSYAQYVVFFSSLSRRRFFLLFFPSERLSSAKDQLLPSSPTIFFNKQRQNVTIADINNKNSISSSTSLRPHRRLSLSLIIITCFFRSKTHFGNLGKQIRIVDVSSSASRIYECIYELLYVSR